MRRDSAPKLRNAESVSFPANQVARQECQLSHGRSDSSLTHVCIIVAFHIPDTLKTEKLVHRILHRVFLIFLPPAPPLADRPAPWLLCHRWISCSRPTAVLTASSKTSSTPFISLLLHSTYIAPIRFATAWPCSGVTGVRP